VDKVKKREVVEQLKSTFGAFGASQVVIVSHNKGLTVTQDKNLRRQVKKTSSQYRVTKNTLAQLAIKGTQFESLNDLFQGPTTIAFSNEPVAICKALVNFSKENVKLEVLGGVVDGKFLDANAVKEMASLLSLDELRGKIVGLLQAPAAQLARVFKAYADKEQTN
jgi:large subunit ribosomal protein L10